MASITDFDSFGTRFHFEPPVEVGDRSVETLQQLAAIAVTGPEASPVVSRMSEQQVSTVISKTSGDPAMIVVALNALVSPQYKVSLT